MNKLKTNILTRYPWGTEIIWSLTDTYMAKTIEILPHNSTPVLSHWIKEVSLIVVHGPLRLTCESVDDVYDLPDGWSWHINAGTLYKYEAIELPVTIIEISNPILEDVVSMEEVTKKKRKSKKDGTS